MTIRTEKQYLKIYARQRVAEERLESHVEEIISDIEEDNSVTDEDSVEWIINGYLELECLNKTRHAD